MADPYGNLAGTFSDLTRNLLTLKGQQMQQALGTAELGMRERGLNETARQHNVSAWGTETAPPAGTATLQARQVQTAEQEHAITAAKTPHLQNFDSISAGMITNQLGKFGINDKDLTDTIRTMGSTPGVTKQQAMQEILTQYPNYRGKLIQDSVDTLLKNSEKDPNYVNTPQGLAHQKFIGMLDSDTTGEQILGKTAVFGPVQRALKMEDENSKAALLAARGVRPVSVAPGGVVIDPVTGEQMFSNPARPESQRPVSVAPGGTLVNPQTGAPIYTAPQKPDKGATDADKRANAKLIADAEGVILANKTSDAAAGKVDEFNQFAEKPYAYVWNANKGTLKSATWEKVKLPSIKGRQVTSKDVYDTAAQRGMTYEEVLKAIGALK